ncbi:MAG: hypothetical protein EXR78_00755 [Deltaproteobacteria bacterium]|nr:hypothetical protein [Deltaproteobacteria bacterium]
MKKRLDITSLFALSLALPLFCPTVHAADFSATRRLDVSQETLRKGLEKVGSPVTFAPRSGSTQGTQEARLPDNAGLVQAGGDKENLTTVVLWLPVDDKGNLVGTKARAYLEAVVDNFVREHEQIVLWVDQVLKRALSEARSSLYLESQLVEQYQFKVAYVPTLSPPMMSMAVAAGEDEQP